MSSEQSKSAQNSANTYGYYQRVFSDIGQQGLAQTNALTDQGLAEGGQPAYMKQGFDTQRAGLIDEGARVGRAGIQGQLAQQKVALAGGNPSAAFAGQGQGANLADSLYSSQLQQGMAGIDQLNKLMGYKLGGTQQAGSVAMGAAGSSLKAMQMLPNYNQTYANVLGGANALGALYGGYQQWQQGQPVPPWGANASGLYGPSSTGGYPGT